MTRVDHGCSLTNSCRLVAESRIKIAVFKLGAQMVSHECLNSWHLKVGFGFFISLGELSGKNSVHGLI